MKYEPSDTTALILEQAYSYVQRAPYRVTARWVFYRLLQDAILTEKADYKKLLGFLSKARKGFYGNWTPYTLADPTRSARVRGGGFDDGQEWVNAVANTTECNLDRWASQDNYVEIWFEAAAMQGQFEFHADENIPLLAFHGDVSIPEKWEAAVRLLRRWWSNPRPIIVLYYGDLDPKGLQIPQSARRDILTFVGQAMQDVLHLPFDEVQERFDTFQSDFQFIRVGLNRDQIDQYQVPENPDRPGTYQWEGLDDAAAQELIAESSAYIDLERFDEVRDAESDITQQFRDHLEGLELDNEEDS